MNPDDPPRISIVVPVFNEEDNIRPLVESVQKALGDLSWELLLIDDGSTDSTAPRVAECARSDSRVRLVGLARNYGQTAATMAGFDHARGRFVVTMDGDLQNDPRDIPLLLEKLEQGYGLVAGYREERKDRTITRRLPSWIANRLVRWISAVQIRDTGCSLRAYRAEVVHGLSLYSEMHRFIPAMAAAMSGARITEIPVRHHSRRHGTSKYGLSRIWRVLLDLLTIAMIRSFRDRPLLMFSLPAAVFFLLGTGFAGLELIAVQTFQHSKAVALVLPGTAALMFGLALYLVMLGLIGEVLLRRHWRRVRSPVAIIREVPA